MSDSKEVVVTFKLKEGVSVEDLVDAIKTLTFQEDLSILNEQVESLQFQGDPIEYLNH